MIFPFGITNMLHLTLTSAVMACLLFQFTYCDANVTSKLGVCEKENCSENLAEMALRLLAVDFEVFGIVQGVSFRAYTKRQAQKLNLCGWVQNTIDDTVIGTLQGESEKVNEMKNWLQTTGSPTSRIDKVVFKNEQVINHLTFKDFVIKH